VAARTAQTFLGYRGAAVASAVFLISIVGALNGVLMAMARIPFAMARDGLLVSKLGELSHGTHVPSWSVMLLTVWAAALALSGTFDQLTDMTMFTAWIFYALGGVAVLILRRKMPDAPRPYRTAGYPVVPLLFVVVAVALVANALVANPVESVIGLMLIALGGPVYLYYRAANRKARVAAASHSSAVL
jgi:APA family basic amino acid/polyamine antiporter